MSIKKIFHLIPHKGIGGVETAAKTCEEIHKSNLFRAKMDELAVIVSNTYKPPIVSREKPIKIYFNNIVNLVNVFPVIW